MAIDATTALSNLTAAVDAAVVKITNPPAPVITGVDPDAVQAQTDKLNDALGTTQKQ